MDLQKLSNAQLEQGLVNLVLEERKLLHLVLLHIKEVDSRRFYLEKGRHSLFDYLVKDLGYSSSGAQRRIEGARLVREIPEVAEKIREGSLHLSQVGEFLRAVRQKEFETKTKIGDEEKFSLLSSIECKSISETQKILSRDLDLKLRPVEIKFVQKDESVHINLSFSKELYDKLKLCRDISSHKMLKMGASTWADTIEVLADHFLKTIEAGAPSAKKLESEANGFVVKERLRNDLSNPHLKSEKEVEGKAQPIQAKIKSKNRKNSMIFTAGATVKVKTPKTLTSKTRKLVRKIYQHCQHRNPITQQTCGSQFLLEVDHQIPRWAGGTHDLSNLTLLCSAHNKAKYRREASLS